MNLTRTPRQSIFDFVGLIRSFILPVSLVNSLQAYVGATKMYE